MNMEKAVNLVKSLYHLGKIRLTETGPEILDQEVLIVPKDLFTQLIELYADDPLLEQSIYHVMRRSVYQFCQEIDDTKDIEPAEMLQILLHLTQMNGYGHIEINDYDKEDRTAAFYVRDLPSDDVRTGYAFKGDTYWAGMLAGGMSHVFGQSVDAVETQCVLDDNNANSCRFLVGPTQVLKQKHPELYKEKFEQPVLNVLQQH